MTLRSDCVQVTRISVQLSRARGLRTFQLYPALSQAPAPWRVACALAWAGECTRTRSVTESEMKWYNTSCWILYQPGSGTQACSVGDKTILLNLDFFSFLMIFLKAENYLNCSCFLRRKNDQPVIPPCQHSSQAPYQKRGNKKRQQQ